MSPVDPGALVEQADRMRHRLDQDPDDPMLWLGLGRILLLLGLPDEAIAPLLTATRLAPQHTDAFLDLGRAHLESGDSGEAARMFAHAIALAEKAGDSRTGREIHVLLKQAEKRGEPDATPRR